MTLKDVWRSAIMRLGEPFVMEALIIMMQLLFVASLDSQEGVSLLILKTVSK